MILSMAVGVAACSDSSSKPNPAKGSDWDEMHWDEGEWA
jgi:hypothetical protein